MYILKPSYIYSMIIFFLSLDEKYSLVLDTKTYHLKRELCDIIKVLLHSTNESPYNIMDVIILIEKSIKTL